jgi:hypothetical protein
MEDLSKQIILNREIMSNIASKLNNIKTIKAEGLSPSPASEPTDLFGQLTNQVEMLRDLNRQWGILREHLDTII